MTGDREGLPWEPCSFGQVRERPCPRCGGEVTYKGGNWHCDSFTDTDHFTPCNWSTARDGVMGKTTLEGCPKCNGTIVYNGNYFCMYFGQGCDWALPSPARTEADKALALRLTGQEW
jgi:hypothetical protein